MKKPMALLSALIGLLFLFCALSIAYDVRNPGDVIAIIYGLMGAGVVLIVIGIYLWTRPSPPEIQVTNPDPYERVRQLAQTLDAMVGENRSWWEAVELARQSKNRIETLEMIEREILKEINHLQTDALLARAKADNKIAIGRAGYDVEADKIITRDNLVNFEHSQRVTTAKFVNELATTQAATGDNQSPVVYAQKQLEQIKTDAAIRLDDAKTDNEARLYQEKKDADVAAERKLAEIEKELLTLKELMPYYLWWEQNGLLSRVGSVYYRLLEEPPSPHRDFQLKVVQGMMAALEGDIRARENRFVQEVAGEIEG